jgi:hypothetical protein
MLANEPTAALMRDLHPGRVRQHVFSDRVNPAKSSVKVVAEQVRKNRRPVNDDNVFAALEQTFSDSLVRSFNLFRDVRNASQEVMFKTIFEQPMVQRVLGVTGDRTTARGDETQRRTLMAAKIEALKAREIQGGTLEAFVRICAYIHKGQPAAEERGFRALKQIYDEAHEDTRKTLVEFKDAVREQTFLVRFDEEHALETLTVLLKTPNTGSRPCPPSGVWRRPWVRLTQSARRVSVVSKKCSAWPSPRRCRSAIGRRSRLLNLNGPTRDAVGPNNPSRSCSTSLAVVLEFIGKSGSHYLTPGGRILLKFNNSALELLGHVFIR